MSQFISPSIFDSIFCASIFPRRISNLSNSSIGEFGGLYQFERRNGLLLFAFVYFCLLLFQLQSFFVLGEQGESSLSPINS